MKAHELISILEDLNPDTEVYFLPANGMYAQDFAPYVKENVTIHAFFGNDFKGAVIGSGGQVGGV